MQDASRDKIVAPPDHAELRAAGRLSPGGLELIKEKGIFTV